MSRSQRSIDFDDEMMHHMIDMDSYKSANNTMQHRKPRIRRMEEMSHSLDDGMNNEQEENFIRQGGNRGRQMEPQYDDIDGEDEDFVDDDYIDDYYYNNSNNVKPIETRPKSYNEKYTSPSYTYDDYESGGNFQRNRYSLNESAMSKNRFQQSPVALQKHSTLRRSQGGPSGVSGNGQHGSNKHILFNDEDDVHYVNDKKQLKTSSSTSALKPKTSTSKKEPLSASSLFSSKKKPSKEDLSKPEKSSAQQVMKAKLKIQSMVNDDSALHMRSTSKQNTLHRHHSVEAKLPSHGNDRSNMSPTIMEEIEFEMQDVETETDREVEREPEKEIVEKVKEKSSKDKDKASKEKKGDSAPTTPTVKKSLKAHLTNHKKLFKVPDIDLNHLKFSCFFSSNKNIALKGAKKEEITSKSAEAINESSPKSSPKSSPTTKSPPESPKKLVKSESKSDKIGRLEEKLDKSNSSRTANSKNTGSGSTIQSSSECFRDDISGSASDVEFEVI